MEKDRELSLFQVRCESALAAALVSMGVALNSRELLGVNETYVRALLGDSDLVVYIYVEEAQYHSAGGLAGLYESQDYSSPESLQQAFVSGVCAAFAEWAAADNSFKPKPFRGSA